jgi:hypothetical protein
MNKLQADTALNEYVLAWLDYTSDSGPNYVNILVTMINRFDKDQVVFHQFYRMGTDARLNYQSRVSK